MSKSDPNKVIFVGSVSASTIMDNTDSSYLRNALQNDNYTASLFDKSIITSQTDSLRDFIVMNKNQINKDKILV